MGYFNIILLCYFYSSTNAVYRWAQLPNIVDCTYHLYCRLSVAGCHTYMTLASHNCSPSHHLIITDRAPPLCHNLKAAEDLQDYLVTSFCRCKNEVSERVSVFSMDHIANLRQSCIERELGLLTLRPLLCSLLFHSTELVSPFPSLLL